MRGTRWAPDQGHFQASALVSSASLTPSPTTPTTPAPQALRSVGKAGEAEDIGVVLSLGTGDPPTEKVLTF